MAVIIVIGENSWTTRLEAATYFEEKFDGSAWATLTDLQKDQLLITAYRWITQQPNLSIPAASTAIIVKQAQCEAAWFVYKYWDEFEKRRALIASGVKSFEISNFSEDLTSIQFPGYIISMLQDFIVNEGGFFPTISRELKS